MEIVHVLLILAEEKETSIERYIALVCIRIIRRGRIILDVDTLSRNKVTDERDSREISLFFYFWTIKNSSV